MKIYELINKDIKISRVKKESTSRKIIETLIAQPELNKEINGLSKELIEEDICFAMKSVSSEYKKDKLTVVETMLGVVKDLNKKGLNVKLDRPDFNFTNETERQLFLLKFFHPTMDHTLEDACDVLWMYNERKIRDDISDINNGSLSFLGNKVKIHFNINKVETSSSVHPIFLVDNLSQIITHLEGLKALRGTIYEAYALRNASNIWFQLSEYARERILFVLDELMDEDIEFYYQLKQEDNLFSDEYMHGTDNILYFYKNGEECYLAYYDENHNVKKMKCFIKNMIDFKIFECFDISNNKLIQLKKEDIICCVKNKKDFIKY